MKSTEEIGAKMDELAAILDGDFGGSGEEAACIEGWIAALEWVQ